MKKLTVMLCVIGLLFTGCSTFAGKRKAKENEISRLAINYVKEKYGMTDAEVIEVSLASSPNGPIPSFKRKIPNEGVVRMKQNGEVFNVLVSTNGGKLIGQTNPLIADDYQAADIKRGIEEHIIRTYGVSKQYHIRKFDVSSLIGEGEKLGYFWISHYFSHYNSGDRYNSYFTLSQKYEGDIAKFLKEQDYSIQLEIFFKGEEKDARNHAEQSKAFLDKMVEIFGNGESEIQVYVNKEHKFMDDKMRDIFRQADDYGENIDPVLYGPVYNFCNISVRTYSEDYIAFSKKQSPYTELKRVDFHGNRYRFIAADQGISLASLVEDVDFADETDFIYSAVSMDEDDPLRTADFKELDRREKGRYEYRLLNDRIYRVDYAKPEQKGEKNYGNDMIAVSIDKSLVPQPTDDLLIVEKLQDGSLAVNYYNEYVTESEDSLIGEVLVGKDFAVVRRTKIE
ncbi:hypothetical protein LBW89_12495 [Paenibacillus sp. alder61]|uniref:hypothetical protein n=1 Tax=Paenibacillus sp. alder61 TaxID=2862948 RepID=UPI001CD2EA26|nr:hypothetical protein [Paenibacillus sp. alder61]MCA1293838.1 hypothetical protein [Paenibacillus sp. alder61]